MNYYRLMIEGKNILLRFKDKNYGFFTTRFIKAKDFDEAEQLAFQSIEIELKRRLRNTKENPAELFTIECDCLESFEGVKPPGKGFSFFPEGVEEQDGLELFYAERVWVTKILDFYLLLESWYKSITKVLNRGKQGNNNKSNK